MWECKDEKDILGSVKLKCYKKNMCIINLKKAYILMDIIGTSIYEEW